MCLATVLKAGILLHCHAHCSRTHQYLKTPAKPVCKYRMVTSILVRLGSVVVSRTQHFALVRCLNDTKVKSAGTARGVSCPLIKSNYKTTFIHLSL